MSKSFSLAWTAFILTTLSYPYPIMAKAPETTQRMVNAFMESSPFLMTHCAEECIDIVKDKSQPEAERELRVACLNEINEDFNPDSIIEQSGHELMVRVNSEAGPLKTLASEFSRITNLEFVRKADQFLII